MLDNYLPESLRRVACAPGMYLPNCSFDSVVSFLQGFDLALQGALLCGYREWLVVQMGGGSNLSWSQLVHQSILRTRPAASSDSIAEVEGVADYMFQSLNAFLAERSKSNGLRNLFMRYQQWLQKQEWYDQSSPD